MSPRTVIVGARTANIIAALWPERCKAMVSVSGYLVGQSRGKHAAATAPSGVRVVVPVLFRDRTRAHRVRKIPPRFREAHLAARLAEMGFRRCYVRSQRGGVRESGSCRDRDPQLPLATRRRARR